MNEYIQELQTILDKSSLIGFDYQDALYRLKELVVKSYNRGVEDSIAVYKDKSEYDYHEIIDSLTKLTNK